eukprot:CAMPEP_0183784876 /NCGR_PEP_ID=MMETSP0739-20130205/66214_1 /TAXON_ID=385413 /ORGANISM="Thalassiosira miniscula, Strain CCMP1093" /LENGTH=233 /DNA_ID=CAMNT_0026028867 /DNA_START=244 /DNA_END=945 /DNA_ORIENTATION=-
MAAAVAVDAPSTTPRSVATTTTIASKRHHHRSDSKAIIINGINQPPTRLLLLANTIDDRRAIDDAAVGCDYNYNRLQTVSSPLLFKSNHNRWNRPTTNTAAAARQHNRRRRVCFIDEVSSSSGSPTPRNLVTHTHFRPSTTLEEKLALYYNSSDYSFFALEDQYSKLETMIYREPQPKPKCLCLSWVDCMVYDGDYGHGLHLYGDDDNNNSDTVVEGSDSPLRKVRRFHELQS